MAEKPQETKPQDAGATADASARQAAERGEAAERTVRGTAQGMRRGGEAIGEVTRQGGEAGAAALRHAGTTVGQTMQRGAQAMAEQERGMAEGFAQQWEQTSQHVAILMQDAARDMRALFAMPGLSRDGMVDLREGIGGLMDGMARTNQRMMQELFHIASPLRTIEWQQRISAAYLDTMMRSTATMLRGARRAADDALRPLEERAGQRRGVAGFGGKAAGHGCVADVMETDVAMASPDDTVQHAAQMMREADAGALPVGEGDRLVGMLTDRDVALRLVAEGRDPRQTRVREVMTSDVQFVFEDEDLEDVADSMAEQRMRRLPVVNREKQVVGVLSFADVARRSRGPRAGRTWPPGQREAPRQPQAAE